MTPELKTELSALLTDLLGTIECGSCIQDSDTALWQQASIQKLLKFSAKHELDVVSLNGSVVK